jgi:hypothetical protein
MTTETVRYEPWPVWARLILIALLILALISALPWIFMWTGMGMNMMGMDMGAMASACLSMMERMR